MVQPNTLSFQTESEYDNSGETLDIAVKGMPVQPGSISCYRDSAYSLQGPSGNSFSFELADISTEDAAELKRVYGWRVGSFALNITSYSKNQLDEAVAGLDVKLAQDPSDILRGQSILVLAKPLYILTQTTTANKLLGSTTGEQRELVARTLDEFQVPHMFVVVEDEAEPHVLINSNKLKEASSFLPSEAHDPLLCPWEYREIEKDFGAEILDEQEVTLLDSLFTSIHNAAVSSLKNT